MSPFIRSKAVQGRPGEGGQNSFLLRRALLAALSGVLLILIFPKFNFEPLAWVVLVPLLAAIDGVSPRRAFWLGWLFGLVGYTGILHWLTGTMVRYGGIPGPTSVMVMLLLVLYIGLYTAAFAYLLVRVAGERPLLRFAFAPVLWTTLELVRTHFLSGFPWGSLGYAQFLTLPVIQVADLTGVYGVSFLLVLVNAAVWHLLRHRRERGLAVGVTTALIVLAVLIYGNLRLRQYGALLAEGGASSGVQPVRVALLQGNIEQDVKWDRSFQKKTLAIYRDLTLQAKANDPDLIVWPETAAPFFFTRDRESREVVMGIAEEAGVPLLFGGLAMDEGSGVSRRLNSAFFLSSNGSLLGRYDKIHLVPFGEYVPLGFLRPLFAGILQAVGEFSSGSERVVLEGPGGPLSVLICYEVIFPNEVRQFVRGGARYLVNLTNDAWFGRTAAPFQHVAAVALRAVENRVPIVRAANTGITAVIDPTGQIRQPTDLFVRTQVAAEVLPRGQTLSAYTAYGDVFAYLSSAIVLVVLGFSKFGRRR